MKRMENYKAVVVSILSMLAAFLNPISGDLFTLIWLFLANFFVGLITGVVVNGERFNKKKAQSCLVEALIFFASVAFIFVIGKFKNEQGAALQCISTLVYLTLYFYGMNICKNMRHLFVKGTPPYKVFDFIYEFGSMAFVSKIPHLQDYLNSGIEIEQENGKD